MTKKKLAALFGLVMALHLPATALQGFVWRPGEKPTKMIAVKDGFCVIEEITLTFRTCIRR